jgi:hypothetical protein
LYGAAFGDESDVAHRFGDVPHKHDLCDVPTYGQFFDVEATAFVGDAASHRAAIGSTQHRNAHKFNRFARLGVLDTPENLANLGPFAATTSAIAATPAALTALSKRRKIKREKQGEGKKSSESAETTGFELARHGKEERPRSWKD